MNDLRIGFSLLLLWCYLSLGIALSAPAQFSVDLPNGESVEFQAVFLELDAKNPVSALPVEMGYIGENRFDEASRTVKLAGSFVCQHPNRKVDEWCYYLSKTEISCAQWDALLQSQQASKDLPVTGISYAQVFDYINRFNLNALNDPAGLPKIENQTGYFRLPTEVEWEFAARGGLETSKDRREASHPYEPERLTEYEYFQLNSGNGNVKPCGSLKPNPLGLFDMLGNAEEMTCSLYSLEYGNGRTGGFVAKGGSANTRQDDLRVSRRTEVVPYFVSRTGKAVAPTNSRRGFRLAYVAPLRQASISTDIYQQKWEEYMADRVFGDAELARILVENRSHTREIEKYQRSNQELKGSNDQLKEELRILQRGGDRVGGQLVAQLKTRIIQRDKIIDERDRKIKKQDEELSRLTGQVDNDKLQRAVSYLELATTYSLDVYNRGREVQELEILTNVEKAKSNPDILKKRNLTLNDVRDVFQNDSATLKALKQAREQLSRSKKSYIKSILGLKETQVGVIDLAYSSRKSEISVSLSRTRALLLLCVEHAKRLQKGITISEEVAHKEIMNSN